MKTKFSCFMYPFLALLWLAPAFAAEGALDPARIEQLTGLQGTLNQKEGVFKVNFPRKDIQATVASARLATDQGLTAWAAFARAGDHAMVMGDIVLLENEVNPVLSAALDNGLEVTALHNHFLWDAPKVMFMHIGGVGDEEVMARAVGQVFGKLKEVIATKPGPPTANVDPAKTSLDPRKLEQIIGTAGTLNNGVYKIVIGRTAKMGQHETLLARIADAPGRTYSEQKLALTDQFAPVGYFGKNVWFRTVIDAAKQPDDSFAIVFDWKSGKPTTDETQMQLIAATMMHHMPRLERVRTALVFVNHDHTERGEYVRGDLPEIWANILPRVNRLRQAREDEDYPPKPGGLCRRYCAVKTCPHWGVGG